MGRATSSSTSSPALMPTPGGWTPAALGALAWLALVRAGCGRPREAAPYLERGAKIRAGGDDWRGAAGRVALAEAAPLVADGLADRAAARFGAAIETFARYSLPWD